MLHPAIRQYCRLYFASQRMCGNHPNFANPGLSGTATTGYPAAGTPRFPLGFGESSESIAAGLGGGGNTGGFNPLFQQGGRGASACAPARVLNIET